MLPSQLVIEIAETRQIIALATHTEDFFLKRSNMQLTTIMNINIESVITIVPSQGCAKN